MKNSGKTQFITTALFLFLLTISAIFLKEPELAIVVFSFTLFFTSPEKEAMKEIVKVVIEILRKIQ
jgi:energy-coupling factor transporter transmembrane protein EcfT